MSQHSRVIPDCGYCTKCEMWVYWPSHKHDYQP